MSDREVEILQRLAEVKNNCEIAQKLHLSLGRVKNDLTQIFCEIDVRDRTQAALWARQNLPKVN